VFRLRLVGTRTSLPNAGTVWSAGYPHVLRHFSARRQLALPSSQALLMKTCPALRPRWCPVDLPLRLQDCCLPHTRTRSAFPPRFLSEAYPSDHNGIAFQGSITRPVFSFRPASDSGYPAYLRTSLQTCRLHFSLVGLERHALTHWTTSMNFMRFPSIPSILSLAWRDLATIR